MRDTNLTIIVEITSHLLCPRQRSAATSEKECQTVILPRVIEKSSCDPRFTSTYSMSANRLNVLVTLMLAVALLVTESGNAQRERDGYPQYEYPQKRNNVNSVNMPQKYCGKKLSTALQIICDGVYNSMFKKNGHSDHVSETSERDMQIADYPVAYEYAPIPFLPRARAQAMLDGRLAGRRYRRQSRGIHEECCINPCTINELSTYCAL